MLRVAKPLINSGKWIYMYFNIADMYIYIWAVIVDFIMG